jgi:hypothetical protein
VLERGAQFFGSDVESRVGGDTDEIDVRAVPPDALPQYSVRPHELDEGERPGNAHIDSTPGPSLIATQHASGRAAPAPRGRRQVSALVRFFRLPRRDALNVIGAGLLILTVRIGLTRMRFGTVQQLLAGIVRPSAKPREAPDVLVRKVGWAVTAMSRRIPGSTCLTQALAAQLILARLGVPARLEIGVASGNGTPFRAHAWVVWEHSVVVGSGYRAYTPLVAWGGVSNSGSALPVNARVPALGVEQRAANEPLTRATAAGAAAVRSA